MIFFQVLHKKMREYKFGHGAWISGKNPQRRLFKPRRIKKYIRL